MAFKQIPQVIALDERVLGNLLKAFHVDEVTVHRIMIKDS